MWRIPAPRSMQVFYASPWVPVEWIRAYGLEPRGAWFAPPLRSTAVPEGVCAFARSLAGLAKAQPQAAWIFTTACDQMRRAADAVVASGASHIFLFNLPATWQTPAARRLYHAELARLGKFLETLGGHAPTDPDFERAIRDYERRRARLREFIKQSPARLGAEALMTWFDDESLPAERGHFSEQPTAALGRAAATGGVPLALVGGPLLPTQWLLFDAIESAGGRVVLNATEPGERCLLPPFPNRAAGQNLPALLADHYFDHAVDVFHRPNSRLYAWLGPRLAERGVRGIVLWAHVGCDLWRAETASLREAFGLPVLVLESHEAGAGGLRDTNRLAAFLEALRPGVQPLVAGARKGCTSPDGPDCSPLLP